MEEMEERSRIKQEKAAAAERVRQEEAAAEAAAAAAAAADEAERKKIEAEAEAARVQAEKEAEAARLEAEKEAEEVRTLSMSSNSITAQCGGLWDEAGMWMHRRGSYSRSSPSIHGCPTRCMIVVHHGLQLLYHA